MGALESATFWNQNTIFSWCRNTCNQAPRADPPEDPERTPIEDKDEPNVKREVEEFSQCGRNEKAHTSLTGETALMVTMVMILVMTMVITLVINRTMNLRITLTMT